MGFCGQLYALYWGARRSVAACSTSLGCSKYSHRGTLSTRAGVVQVLALRGTQVRSRVQYVAQIDLAGQLIGGLSQQWMQKRMGCLRYCVSTA